MGWRVVLLQTDLPARVAWQQILEQDPLQLFQTEVYTHLETMLQRLSDHPPDAVLIEHSPPQLDGLELLESIAREAQFPILLLGPPDEALAQQAFQRGASGYFPNQGPLLGLLGYQLARSISDWKLRQQYSQTWQSQNQQPGTEGEAQSGRSDAEEPGNYPAFFNYLYPRQLPRSPVALEPSNAEEAVRKSEEKYRTLFETMDEGFCLIELLYNPAGQAVNWRYLEVNQVYERLTGQKKPLGKLGSEVAPNTESYWLSSFEQVAQTGVPLRMEGYHQDTERWYLTHISRVGNSKPQLALVFDDITERKHREQQQQFLLELSDTLRPLSDGAEVEANACRLLGEHLGVERVYYPQINQAGNHAQIEGEYLRGDLPSVAGIYPLTRFGWALPILRQGTSVIINDIYQSKLIPAADRAALEATQQAALISVPLLKNALLVGSLTVSSSTPRPWKAEEVELVRDTLERMWAAAERVRATLALRESEERFRAIVSQTTAGIYWADLEGRLVFANQTLAQMLGYSQPELLGKTIWELSPQEFLEDNRRRWERLRSEGTPLQFEQQLNRKDGSLLWVIVSASATRNRSGQPQDTVAVLVDISRHKQDEAELARLLKFAQQSEKEAMVLALIANTLSLDTPLENNLSTISQYIAEFTGALACTLKLYQDDEHTISLLVSPQQPAGLEEGLGVLHRAGVPVPSYRALKKRGLEVVKGFRSQALADSRYALLRPQLRQAKWDTAVAIPLLQGQRALGVMLVYYPPGHEPSRSDLIQLSTLGNQVALVVQNSQLFQQAQEKAALEERARLARELHDSVSQALYGVTLGIHAARNALKKSQIPETEHNLEYGLQMAQTASAEMKNLIFELRPEVLEQEGLVAALQRHIYALKLRHRQQFETELGLEPNLPLKSKELLLRIAQEALNNSLKHAKAQRISLKLLARPKSVRLEIRDNGQGFDPTQNFPGHLGLVSMRERAATLGSVLHIESGVREGTVVRIEVPRSQAP